MDKHNMTKAFTMMESLLVLLIVQVCMLCCIPLLKIDLSLYRMDEVLKSELLCLQMNAMNKQERKEVVVGDHGLQMQHQISVDVQGSSFSINEFGHVSKPSTLLISNGRKGMVWKIWLGNGRIIYDE